MDIEGFKEKYPFAYAAEVQISDYFAENNVAVQDILMLIRNLMARSRAALTFDQLHAWVHKLVQDAEYMLQTGIAFVTEDGDPVNMMLAEEREATGETEFGVPDTIPEDWA